jgi:DNA mismatch endonuclease (patch repair protein)
MRATKRRDTRPEQRIRSLLHRRGLRFRVDYPIRTAAGRKRRPDIAFTRLRLAVFIDGCFWHRCPVHCRLPTRNRDYWEAKLSGNAKRDQLVDREMRASGWTVLRFWEHEAPEKVAEAIEQVVRDSSTDQNFIRRGTPQQRG